MSMIGSLIDELNKSADEWDGSNMFELARMCREAADTIWQLRDDLQRANAENAKLRELVDYMTPIAWYEASERERDRMRELGGGGGRMSYDIYLNDPVTGGIIELDDPHQMRGGNYTVGGTTEAWLNVTYNYAKHYYRVMGEKGIRTIYGMTGAESIPVLKAAIDELGDDVDPDYWASTEGNAKRALCNLLALAQMRPDGVWDGD